jgi:hypothetical protein
MPDTQILKESSEEKLLRAMEVLMAQDTNSRRTKNDGIRYDKQRDTQIVEERIQQKDK